MYMLKLILYGVIVRVTNEICPRLRLSLHFLIFNFSWRSIVEILKADHFSRYLNDKRIKKHIEKAKLSKFYFCQSVDLWKLGKKKKLSKIFYLKNEND